MMQQLEGSTGKSTPHMKYKIRAGTIDSGKKYEYKIATLLSLRCIDNEEDMWISSNVDGVGAFDDIILRQGSKTFMLQLKHKDDPKPIVEREFVGQKGDFTLQKYFKDINNLKGCGDSKCKKSEFINYLGSLDDICFVLFTNRDTKICDFLEQSYDALPLLRTGDFAYKINASKVLDQIKISLDNVDYLNNIYLLPNQVHAKDLDRQIAEEIQKLAKIFNLETLDVKHTAERFTKYVADWAEGTLGGHYCLTKSDVICKLTELFLCQYEVKFNHEKFAFYTCDKKRVWNDLLRDEIITVVDFEETVSTFLLEYLGSEVTKYLHEVPNFWKDSFSAEAQTKFYLEHSCFKIQILKIIGNRAKIKPLDVYKCLWMHKQIPLLVEINTNEAYHEILHILKLSNYSYKVVIINKSNKLSFMINAESKPHFISMQYLNEENKNQILKQEVKLQGRPCAILKKLVDQDMLQHIKCKDVINILLENFNIGNSLKPLPEYFVPRNVSKVFLSEVTELPEDEIFLIEETLETSFEMLQVSNSNVCKLEDINENDLEKHNIIVSSRKVRHGDVEKLKSSKRPVHFLKISDGGCLEWKTSFGSAKKLKKFQKTFDWDDTTREESILTWIAEHFPDQVNDDYSETTETFIANKLYSLVNIISGVPGMGKSVLMDYVALQAPTEKWVLKIDLNGHQKYYRTETCKISTTPAEKHVEYFTKAISNQYKKYNKDLSKAIFKKLLKTKDIFIILDGFDEISVTYKDEVTNIAKSLSREGYCLWITTRPHMQSHLEKELEAFSIRLESFSVNNQKEFLTNYFCAHNTNLETNSKVNQLVEILLKAAKKNLNDWDAQFTGIPLQTKLLADLFKDACMNYVNNEDLSNFNENFDLIYLYETFINGKINILCDKFGPSAEDMHFIFKEHQSLFAVKLLFFQYENLVQFKSIIDKRLNGFYENEPKKFELLQREGVVTVDSDFNVMFVHRTFGEFLAAQWLAENINHPDQKQKEFVHILIKERFTPSYRFLFGIFDRILTKDFPVHLAIVHNKEDDVLKMLKSNPEVIKTVDKGGRTVLHIVALYGLQFPLTRSWTIHKFTKFVTGRMYNSDAMIGVVEEILNHNKLEYEKDTLGYCALDYALANQCLGIANKIHEKCVTSAINANLQFYLRNIYFLYCVLLNSETLLNVLLHYFISKELLSGNILKNKCVGSYAYANLINCGVYFEVALERSPKDFACNYRRRYTGTTALKFLQINSISASTYSDIRHAVCFGSVDNVETLLSEGTNINNQDAEYNTLLHYAVLHNKPEMIDLILAKNADVNIQNENENTPLHLAFHVIDDETLSTYLSVEYAIVNKLIAKGADTNIKNYVGNTPLYLAVELKKLEWIKLFMSKGADVNIKNDEGFSPLSLALKRKHSNILKLL